MNEIFIATREQMLDLIREGVRQELQTFAPQVNKTAPGVNTKKQAAAELGISTPTLDGLIRSGQLKSFNIGRHVKIKQSDIEDYLNKKG